MTDRRRYQREVERLLDQIRRQVRELRRRYAAGARGPALQELENEVARTRSRLAYVISHEQDDGFRRAA